MLPLLRLLLKLPTPKSLCRLGLACLCLPALILASSLARADVKGIPASSQFASAAFPHARKVKGCTPWRRPERLGDEWGPVSFAGACEENDCSRGPRRRASQ